MQAVGGFDATYVLPLGTSEPARRINTSSVAWSIAVPLRSLAVRIGLVPKPVAEMCFCAQNTYCDCSSGELCTQSWPACSASSIVCSCGGLMVCNGGKCADFSGNE